MEVVEAAPKAQEDAALLAKCQNMFLTTINALAAVIFSRFVCAARARAVKRIGEMLPPCGGAGFESLSQSLDPHLGPVTEPTESGVDR